MSGWELLAVLLELRRVLKDGALGRWSQSVRIRGRRRRLVVILESLEQDGA